MSGFKTELQLAPQSDGVTWKVLQPFVYECGEVPGAPFQVISVPAGFLTDLASIPRELWDCMPPWGKYGFGAVLHDWLYSTQPVQKSTADLIFLNAMVDSGVPELTRQIIYHAVQMFGGHAWDQHTKELQARNAA